MTRFTEATIVCCSGHKSSAKNGQITYCLFFCISMVLWNLKLHFISVITLYFNPCVSSEICCIMIMFLFLDRQLYFNDSVTILFFNHVPFGRLCIWARRLWFENARAWQPVEAGLRSLGYEDTRRLVSWGWACLFTSNQSDCLAFLNTIMRSYANLLSCSNLQSPH